MIDQDAMIELYQFAAFAFLAPYLLGIAVAAALIPIALGWQGARAAWRWWTRSFF